MKSDITTTSPTLSELLEQSAATAEFRTAALEVQTKGRANERLQFGGGNPPVKAIRALCGLLESFPQLAIDRVEVEGASGCSDYRGEITVNDSRRFRFVWDCAWKARDMGWKDYFGEPDQIRAAREFGYRCFEKFEEIA
ncbi:hypothetical protein BH09SUM1_BH09SUM1_17100 [soil metagenome]